MKKLILRCRCDNKIPCPSSNTCGYICIRLPFDVLRKLSPTLQTKIVEGLKEWKTSTVLTSFVKLSDG